MEEKREKQTPTNTHSLENQTRKPMQSSISIIPVFHMLFHMLRIDKRWREVEGGGGERRQGAFPRLPQPGFQTGYHHYHRHRRRHSTRTRERFGRVR